MIVVIKGIRLVPPDVDISWDTLERYSKREEREKNEYKSEIDRNS